MNTSKRRRNKKAATAGAVLLAVMLAASACGGTNTTNNTNTGNDQGTVNDGPVVDQLPEESGVLEPDVSAPDNTTNENDTTDNNATENNGGVAEEPAAGTLKVGEGTYTGLIDSHSIEIVTAAGATVFQVSEELAATVDSFPSDAKVKFEYTEKAIEGDAAAKQNTLIKIEQLK